MFEHPPKLAPFSVFVRRLMFYLGISVLMVLGALTIGVAGYHWLANLGWVDSLLNAAMILGGMGPVSQIDSTRGKLFAAGYALFSGLVFIILMGTAWRQYSIGFYTSFTSMTANRINERTGCADNPTQRHS